MNAQLSNKSSFAEDRLSALRLEIKALRKVRHEEVRNEANSRRWFSTKRRLPAADIRAVVWSDEQLRFAWFTDGKWFSFDGTWFIKAKDEIAVTHWMATDWMATDWLPMAGPGFVNWIRSIRARVSDRATRWVAPKLSHRNAQIARKVVFYRDRSGKLLTGMPENMAAPHGYEKIVCGSAMEAERLSAIQRSQEGVEHRRRMEERERIDGEIHRQIRSEMHERAANARNAINKDFMRRAIEQMERRSGSPTRYERESFLHSEGYEQGR